MLSRSSQQNSTKLNEVRLRQGFGATAFALYLRCERRLEARLLTTLAATPTRPLGLLHLQTTPPAAWQQHRRSEERRVGKECRSRGSRYHYQQNERRQKARRRIV